MITVTTPNVPAVMAPCQCGGPCAHHPGEQCPNPMVPPVAVVFDRITKARVPHLESGMCQTCWDNYYDKIHAQETTPLEKFVERVDYLDKEIFDDWARRSLKHERPPNWPPDVRGLHESLFAYRAKKSTDDEQAAREAFAKACKGFAEMKPYTFVCMMDLV